MPNNTSEADAQEASVDAAQHSQSLRELLELQSAQLSALRADGQERLDELARAFELMRAALERSGESQGVGADVIVRTLQFADNQAQRLEHLIRAMDQIGNLTLSTAAGDEASWSALRCGIRAGYTMARECEVFDDLFGAPDEALPYAQNAGTSTDGSIELF